LALREQRIFMPPKITDKFNAAIEQMSGAQIECRLSIQHPHIPSYEFGQAKRNWMKKNTIVFEALATAASHRLFREDHQTAEAILGFSRSPRSKTPPTLRASD